MLSLKREKIQAIAYLGKVFTEKEATINFANLNLNVAIIMDVPKPFEDSINNEKMIYSSLMDKISLSPPINFGIFKNIKNMSRMQNGNSDNSDRSFAIFAQHHIDIMGSCQPYSYTYFCKLEEYIDKMEKKRDKNRQIISPMKEDETL